MVIYTDDYSEENMYAIVTLLYLFDMNDEAVIDILDSESEEDLKNNAKIMIAILTYTNSNKSMEEIYATFNTLYNSIEAMADVKTLRSLSTDDNKLEDYIDILKLVHMNVEIVSSDKNKYVI